MNILTVLALLSIKCISALQLLPPINGAGNEAYVDVSAAIASRQIYIESSFASQRDVDDLTLIPPSALEFATTFRNDLELVTNASWSLEQVDSLQPNNAGIFLGAFNDNPQALTYENGVSTAEGYEISTMQNGNVVIRGAGARGMWWGTRTLLQHIISAQGQLSISLPGGSYVDVPAYATRGFMLDAGRKWYSLPFLKDLCTYASFFKMSEFHYHSADNFPLNRGHNETWSEVYSQFALRPNNPDLFPLVQRENETLSAAEFEDFQQHCAQRGVTVITEIEAPGHALSITKWKPELAISPKDLLNLSHPETIPLIKEIWADFLPRLHSKEVHIGADEYDAELADDYIGFVNEMAAFVNETSGKRTRIWGTYEPSPTNMTISKDVIVQHWQYGQSDPVQLVQDGYEIINSDDRWAYMSLKNDHAPINPAPYPQFFNETRILNFADRVDTQWDPSFVNSVNFSMQLSKSEPKNNGAILAAWNDNGPDATTQLEAYYAIRRGIPLVAARAWSGSRGPLLDTSDLDMSIDYFSLRVPGSNLDRVIKGQLSHNTDTPLISWSRNPTSSPSQSTSANESVTIGHGSKGLNYSLSIIATGAFNLSSPDVSLVLSSSSPTDTSNGSATLPSAAAVLNFITSDGWSYPLRSVSYEDSSIFSSEPGSNPGRIWASDAPPFNQTTSSHDVVTFPVPSESSPLNITITTDAVRGSRCWLNGTFSGRFEVLVFGGRNTYQSWSQMAFVAPLDTVSGGGIAMMELWDGMREPSSELNGTRIGPGTDVYQNSAGSWKMIVMGSVTTRSTATWLLVLWAVSLMSGM